MCNVSCVFVVLFIVVTEISVLGLKWHMRLFTRSFIFCVTVILINVAIRCYCTIGPMLKAYSKEK